MTVLAAHQPDIFPYVGFFQKMMQSDYFDLAIYDDYAKDRYMSRVKIGRLHQLTWMNVPVVKKSKTMICDIALKDCWRSSLQHQISKQYKHFPFFKERYYVVERVLDSDHTTLAEIGVSSILSIKDFVGIDRPKIDYLGYNLPKGQRGIGIIELVRRYRNKYDVDPLYLSGAGGHKYMDLGVFLDNGVDVRFSDPQTKWLCSALTPIFLVENFKTAFMVL